MSSSEKPPRVRLRTAMILFGAWALLLMSALSLEHTAFGRFVFQHRATMLLYLVLHGVLHLAALAACIMTLVRGSTWHRVIALVPTLLLLVYGLVAIGGPG